MTNGFLRTDDTQALVVTLLGVEASSLSDEILADTPVGYWRTVDGADSSGNSLPLTPFGSPTAGTSLDASDPDDPSIVLADGMNLWNPEKYVELELETAMSLSFLMKPTTVGDTDRDTVQKVTLYGAYIGDDSKLHAFVDTGVQHEVVSTSTIVVGTTYHVGIAFDGATLKLYINGTSEGSASAIGTIANNSGMSFTLGTSGAKTGFAGTIDEAAVFGTALSATRFAAHAAAGL